MRTTDLAELDGCITLMNKMSVLTRNKVLMQARVDMQNFKSMDFYFINVLSSHKIPRNLIVHPNRPETGRKMKTRTLLLVRNS